MLPATVQVDGVVVLTCQTAVSESAGMSTVSTCVQPSLVQECVALPFVSKVGAVTSVQLPYTCWARGKVTVTSPYTDVYTVLPATVQVDGVVFLTCQTVVSESAGIVTSVVSPQEHVPEAVPSVSGVGFVVISQLP